MRGAFSEIKTRRQVRQMRRLARISDVGSEDSAQRCRFVAQQPGASSGLSFDSFLFCLTLAAIFDNRHELLKKFDSARAAKPLSAVEP